MGQYDSCANYSVQGALLLNTPGEYVPVHLEDQTPLTSPQGRLSMAGEPHGSLAGPLQPESL